MCQQAGRLLRMLLLMMLIVPFEASLAARSRARLRAMVSSRYRATAGNSLCVEVQQSVNESWVGGLARKHTIHTHTFTNVHHTNTSSRSHGTGRVTSLRHDLLS